MSTVARLTAEINLKDELSSGLKKSATVVEEFSKNAAQAIEEFANKATGSGKKAQAATKAMAEGMTEAVEKMSAEMKTALDKIEANFKEFADKADRELNKFQARAKSAWSDVGKGIGELSQKVQAAGLAMTAGITVPIIGLAKSALETAKKMDSLQRGIVAVDHGSKNLQKTLTDLKEIAKLPGLGLVEAREGYINLRAAGIEANLAKGALMGFGNALATVGKGKADLQGVIVALSQISAKGKVYAEEINQIAERVPQIREVMRKAFGTADTEVLGKAGLTAKQFIGAITTELNKLPMVTGGIQNDMENFADAWTGLLEQMGKAIIPLATQVMTTLQPMIENLTETLSKMSPEAKQAWVNLALGVAAAGPVILALGSIGSAISGLVSGAGILSKIWTSLALAIETSGGILGAASGLLEALTGPIGWVIAAVVALVAAWKTNFGGIRDFLVRIYRNIVETFQGWVQMVKDWIEENKDTILPAWKFIVETLRATFHALGVLIEAAWGIIKSVIDAALTIILRSISFTLKILKGDWKGAWEDVKIVVVNIWNNIQLIVLRAIRGLIGIIGSFTGAIGKAFGQDWGMAGTVTLFDDRIKEIEDSMKRGTKTIQTESKKQNDALKNAAKPPKYDSGDGGAKPDLSGVGKDKAERAAKELTSQLVEAMGRSVQSPGGNAASACATFASKVIAKFTDGITDGGKKIEANAAALVQRLINLGAKKVSAGNAAPGSLAYRPGSGPSGVHVGIATGDGRVMDMNGQRDGRRNSFGMSSSKGWNFLDIPNQFISKGFKEGKVSEGFKQAFDEAKKAAEEYAQRLGDVLRLENELTAEKMKASGANLLDVLSMKEFGKAFNELTDGLNKRKIRAEADKIVYDDLLATWNKLAEAAEAQHKAEIAHRKEISDAVAKQVEGYQKEIALISATTEVEKMRWEVTRGAYKEASGLEKAILLAMAAALDAKKKAVEQNQKYAEAWKKVFEAVKKTNEETEKAAEGKYSDYIKSLTQRLLELQEGADKATEALIRQQLAGIKDPQDREKKIKEVLALMGKVSGLEQKYQKVRDYIMMVQEAFTEAANKIWDDGWKGLFTNIIAGIRNIAHELAMEMIKAQIMRAILWGIGQIGGAGAKAGAGKALSGHATGGMVFAGVPTMVGEAGPEAFIPNSNGRIMRTDQLGGAGIIQNFYMTVVSPNAQSFQGQNTMSQIQTKLFQAGRHKANRDGRGD